MRVACLLEFICQTLLLWKSKCNEVCQSYFGLTKKKNEAKISLLNNSVLACSFLNLQLKFSRLSINQGMVLLRRLQLLLYLCAEYLSWTTRERQS